ncbi:hypothetical protein [Massilia eburnea]|uniref:hypothetical protein n=1 Tax=Massilia eburnea TaxID=1776165 RepID=UPI003D6AC7A5
MIRRQLLTLAVLLACQQAAQAADPAAETADWSLRLPVQEKVVFRGQVNYDKAGTGQGGMVYPAPGLVGLLAAIATHAVIVNGVRQGQRSEIEIAADKVLTPYKETLDAFNYGELAGLALPPELGVPTLAADAKPKSGLIISSAPVFYMTQDQSALILDNTVSVFKAGNDKPVYTNTVRVVSRAGEAEDLVAHWKQEDGKRLREESASLFRQSVDIVRSYALAPASAATASAHRTFRYLEGKVDAIERAEPLSEQCGRALVKNLRGWLMSIPLKRARPAAPECAAPAESPTL